MDSTQKADAQRQKQQDKAQLRRGWTTGACATAATKSALHALLTGAFLDPVQISLPKGEQPKFPLCREATSQNSASATIVKDAGDDPDVTHGAKISATVTWGEQNSGIVFKAGEGVGVVTKPGLPIEPGEAAINPVPRRLMIEVAEELCTAHGKPADLVIEVAVEGGEALAEKTWNGRLGIVGGLSILGTTGVVHPFSCAAWIHSIHRGVDVARAMDLPHILAATGSTSETAALKIHELPEVATIDMGDFAGGLLKYLRLHPVPRITIAGGFAKLTKLAQGCMDLHSSRSQVDFDFLAAREAFRDLSEKEKEAITSANTALEVLQMANRMGHASNLAAEIATKAQAVCQEKLKGAATPVDVEIIVTDRNGVVLAQTGFTDGHD